MAVTPVSLGPSLCTWAMAGVTHILCDGPVDPVYLGGEGAALPRPFVYQPCHQLSPATTSAVRGEGRGVGALLRPDAQTQPSGIPGGQVNPRPRSFSTEKSAIIQPSGVAPASVPGFAAAAFGAGSPATWPEPWADWFGRISPAPVLWSYHELGADLTGIGRSAERSAFFKALISELSLPKGSSAFWPSAMPIDADGGLSLRAHPAVYAAGVLRLTPKVFVVFGPQAMADIGMSDRFKPFLQDVVEGKLLLCLPDIDDLLHIPKQRVSAVSLLRAVFTSIGL